MHSSRDLLTYYTLTNTYTHTHTHNTARVCKEHHSHHVDDNNTTGFHLLLAV